MHGQKRLKSIYDSWNLMLKIFRWQGGYAGDTIVSSILSSNPDLISNINYTKVEDNGRTIIKKNKEHVLSCLASWDQTHDFGVLEEKIEHIIKDKQTHIIKNHSYHPFFEKYSDYIVDIVSTNDLLGFTTSANFYKVGHETSKNLREYDKFYNMLEQKDKNESDYYLIYQLACSHYKHNITEYKSRYKILLDKWVDLQYNDIVGYEFDRGIYNHWRKKNEYLINNHNSKIEKICSLVKQELPYKQIRKQLI